MAQPRPVSSVTFPERTRTDHRLFLRVKTGNENKMFVLYLFVEHLKRRIYTQMRD